MHIVVSSSEIIKPLKATPLHPLTTTSSSSSIFLDQFASTGLVPVNHHRLLLFYSAQGDVQWFQNTDMSYRLKKSLSAVLTDQFYPLAGRFSNDDGQSIEWVEYVEARVGAPFVMDQMVSCPNAEELEQLYPPETTATKALLSVQVTIFGGCGGMAIGVRASRAIGDASALARFMRSWASNTASKGGKSVASKLGFADVFPPGDLHGNAWNCDSNASRPSLKILRSADQKLITKRFVFSSSKIAAVTGYSVNPPLTRVQVACAIIFKCLISVVRSRSSKPILLLRPRTPPPLSYAGNPPSSTVEEAESSRGFVRLLRRNIQKFDSDYLKNMLGGDARLLKGNVVQRETRDESKNEVHRLEISSCCAYPYYEMDFGWGTPTWAAVFYAHVENLVTLLSCKNGGGIEAWVTLTEDDMTKFESAERAFLDYANILARI